MAFIETAAVIAKEVAKGAAKEATKLARKTGQNLAVETTKSGQKDAGWAGNTITRVFSAELQHNIPGDHSLESLSKADDLPAEIGEEMIQCEWPQEIGGEAEAFPAELDIGGGEKNGLTSAEKALIMAETEWPDNIVEHIDSMAQYEVYKNAGLHVGEVNGRDCLLKDIDLDYVDQKTGLTNRELMEKGRAPVDAKTGEKIELHHMGQDFNGPFAELCENSEHGDGKDTILHDKGAESWRQDPEKKNQYNNQDRPSHWRARAQEV